jgi:hypothetical protein
MPELEQVPRGEGGAGALVDRDDRQSVRGAGLDGHERDVAGEADDRLARALERRDDEDAVDALHAEPIDGAQHRGAVQRLEADDGDEVAGLVRGALDRVERRRRAVERGVEAHDPERPRTAGDERARRRVRTVVELLHREEHPLAGRGAHPRAPVYYPRDSLVADARELGHVGHHRRATAALGLTAGVAGSAQSCPRPGSVAESRAATGGQRLALTSCLTQLNVSDNNGGGERRGTVSSRTPARVFPTH